MKYLLSLLIIFAIVGPGAAYSKLYIYHIFLMVIFVHYILISLKSNTLKIGNIDRLSKALWIGLLVWSILSIIWSIEISYTLRYLFYLLNGILLIFFFNKYISNIVQLKSMLKIAVLTVGFQILISILEVFSSFRYPLSPYSPYAYLFGREAFDGEVFDSRVLDYIATTPTGFMGNPNNLAAVLTLFLPYFLFMKNKVGILFSVLTIVVIFYTGSRVSIIASLGLILIYLSLSNLKTALKFFIALPILIFIGASFVKVASASKNLKLVEFAEIPMEFVRFATFNNMESQDSIGIRQSLIVNGLEALKDTYYLGVGGGASMKVQEDSGSLVTSMHNFWIEFMVENGIILFMLFAIWYFITVIKLVYIYRHKKNNMDLRKIAGATALSLIGFIPGAISASTTIYMLPMWLVFAVAISTISINKIMRKEAVP